MTPKAFFLPCGEGQRFCLQHPVPDGTARRGAVVYLHPFAEEMNKARRMAALQSRAFAAAGFEVLQIDLFGCGDSSGDFGDASWDHWVDDALLACRWIRQRTDAPLWLWGLRAGGLLAAQAARALAEAPAGLLLWQPPASGKAVLQQFLRLKVMGDALSGAGKGAMAQLQAQLAEGQAVEVAGYRLSPALASGLAAATWTPDPRIGQLECIEIASRPDAGLSPANEALLGAWQAVGCSARGRVVEGPAFWQTTEIEEALALVDASLEAILDGVPA